MNMEESNEVIVKDEPICYSQLILQTSEATSNKNQRRVNRQ